MTNVTFRCVLLQSNYEALPFTSSHHIQLAIAVEYSRQSTAAQSQAPTALLNSSGSEAPIRRLTQDDLLPRIAGRG